jgi:RimJ/RimL family protein N-acetyltransferase
LNENTLSLRPARADDARVIWEWANERAVRAVSFTSVQIPWETHVRWFNSKLSDPNCCLWIANDASGVAAGMVRFEQRNQEALVSVSLDESRRGKNLGALLIWIACRKFFREQCASLINALIKPDNAASIRVFEKAGFENAGQTTVQNQPALRFQLQRGAVAT